MRKDTVENLIFKFPALRSRKEITLTFAGEDFGLIIMVFVRRISYVLDMVLLKNISETEKTLRIFNRRVY
jgi:hypothetical protein